MGFIIFIRSIIVRISKWIKLIHPELHVYIYWMSRKNKFREPEISLQPWQHYQQTQNALNPAQIPFNPETQHHDDQYLHKITNKQYRLNRTASKSIYSRQEARTNKKISQHQETNYVKKNQENLKSFHCMSQNYTALLNDDLDNFVPLNSNYGNVYFRRPSINTTYIGYYDEQPFLIDPTKSRLKESRKSKSTSTNHTRPRTSDATITHQTEALKNDDKEIHDHYYDRATLTVGGYHLQKMLKIKQKLRQKLKRNSQKKDIERGLYVKNTMKIEQDRNNTLESNKSHVHVRTPQSRKSSTKSIQGSKQKIRVDKWKQYMRLKNSTMKQQMKMEENMKNNKFFAVLGGAIYK